MRTGMMRVAGAAGCLAAIVGLGGCRDNGPSRAAGADDALSRDLERANTVASAMALARVGGAGERTRFVSPLEAGSGALDAAPAPPTGGRAPRARAGRSRARTTAHAVAHRVAAAPVVEVAEAPVAVEAVAAPAPATPAPEPAARAPEPAASGPSPDESPAPAAAPADAPVDAPAGEQPERRRGGGWGRIFGGIAGAVIRGGSVGDDDHCERDQPRRRGRMGGGWPMGGVPGGALPMPRGGGTFPSPTYPRY